MKARKRKVYHQWIAETQKINISKREKKVYESFP